MVSNVNWWIIGLVVLVALLIAVAAAFFVVEERQSASRAMAIEEYQQLIEAELRDHEGEAPQEALEPEKRGARREALQSPS